MPYKCPRTACFRTDRTQGDSKHGSDACPDCVTELGIQKRETGLSMGTDQTTSVREDSAEESSAPIVESEEEIDPPLPPVGPGTRPGIQFQHPSDSPKIVPSVPDRVGSPARLRLTKSLIVEPSMSRSNTQSWGSINVQASTSERHNSVPDGHSSRGSSATNPENNIQRIDSYNMSGSPTKVVRFRESFERSDTGPVVLSRDLGEGLDAMILERGGRLETVITNARHGEITVETMAKLSRELVLVSNALADAHVDNYSDSSRQTNDRTVVVDCNARRRSVPELLNLFGEATGDLEPGLIRKESIQSTFAELRPDATVYHDDEVSSSEQSFVSLDDQSDERGRTASSRTQVPGEYGLSAYFDQQDENPGEQCFTAEWPLDPPRIAPFDERLLPGRRAQDIALTPLRPFPRATRSTSTTHPLPSTKSLSNLGSKPPPIKVHRSTSHKPPTGPTLPSHILKTSDFPSSSPGSPLLFTESNLPSLANSAASSSQTSPAETQTQPFDFSNPRRGFSPTRTRAERADSQVIKHVMRMGKNEAVQEAAEAERRARRRKSMQMEAKRSLTFGFGKRD